MKRIKIRNTSIPGTRSKGRLILLSMILGTSLCTLTIHAQSNLNAGIGFTGGSQGQPGLVLELEHEKMFTGHFSLPLRLDVGMISHQDYNSLVFDLHKGFRRYFESGFFAEQSIGLGILSMSNKTGYAWYYDEFGHVLRYGDRAVWGLIPSVTLGGGYNLTAKKGTQNLVWIRPKIFWNLAFTSLDTPYAQVQIGYTRNFK